MWGQGKEERCGEGKRETSNQTLFFTPLPRTGSIITMHHHAWAVLWGDPEEILPGLHSIVELKNPPRHTFRLLPTAQTALRSLHSSSIFQPLSRLTPSTCQTHVMTLTSNPTFSAILKSLVFICIRRFHTGFDQLWVENSIHNPWLGIWRCEGQDCMHCSAPFYIRHFSILGFGCLQRVLEAICHRYRGMMVFSFQLLHFLDYTGTPQGWDLDYYLNLYLQMPSTLLRSLSACHRQNHLIQGHQSGERT